MAPRHWITYFVNEDIVLKGKRIRAEFLIGIALILIIAGAAGSAVTPGKEADRTIANRFGDVIWNHEYHARMKEIPNCTVCHHTAKQGETQLQPCRDCHELPANVDTLITPELFMTVEPVAYEGDNGPPAMVAAHSKCTGCHVAMNEGPTSCRDCHKQTFPSDMGTATWDHRLHARILDMDDVEGMDGNCVSCHHQDEDAKTDGEYRACGTCHKPVAKKGGSYLSGIPDHENAKHGQCDSCHTVFNPEEENIACVDCHRKLEVAHVTDQNRPSLEQAIHEKCSSCHNRDNPELTIEMPTTCTDCHENDPSFIKIEGMNTIVWDHKRHAEYSSADCVTCHHTDAQDMPQLACRSCHGTDKFDIDPLEDSLKEQCTECHEEKGVGLTTWESMTYEKFGNGYMQYQDDDGSFWWDHKFHALGVSLSCQNCHHNTITKDGEFVMARKVNNYWPDEAGHIQNCRSCHGTNGPVASSVAEGSDAPSIKEAYQTICTTCHQSLGVKTREWPDFFKTEPITRQ